MTYLKNFFYSPGGESETGNTPPRTIAEEKESSSADPETKEEDKPIVEKIKEALQDWANKDESDQEFDDTRV